MQPDSKCYNLHGHSWWVEVEIIGDVDFNGMILDFATAKRMVRTYLDSNFDHHLALNERDPLVLYMDNHRHLLQEWGIVLMPFDPTVENMAAHWGRQFMAFFPGYELRVKVWEASTNAATWRSDG
jgi:6-pyruvoyl-tetrahydropterin synthase